jgi:hypothetical protein
MATLRDVVAKWRVEVDLDGFNRLNKRIELANRGLEKLDKEAKQRLKADKVALSIEGWKVGYIKQQNALLAKQALIKKRDDEREMRANLRNQLAARRADIARERANRAARQQEALQRRQRRASLLGGAGGAMFGSTAALGALGGAGWAALRRGVDAREAENLMNVVFGERAGEMRQWAGNASQAMGRSRYQFQDYAGRFGAFLTPMLENQDTTGFGGVAGMSQQLSQLVVDLASFYNTSEDEARQRVYSGLAGETEAVRKLGVDLSDAALEAVHLRQGGTVAYNQLSMGEKTLLRFNKLLRDTTLAQGDAIRTQGDLANMGRALQSSFEDVLTEVGKNLTPQVKEWANWIKNSGMPTFRRLFAESTAFESALEIATGALLTSAAVWAGVKFGAAGAAGGAIGVGAAFGIDEIRATQKGKDSYLSDLLEAMDSSGRSGRQIFDGFSQALIGLADIIIGIGMDLGSVIGNVINFIRGRGSWEAVKNSGGYTAAAAGRMTNAIAAADRAEEERKQERLRVAMAGDVEGFGQIASGSSSEATAEYKALRLQAIQSGQILPTGQDVADNIVGAVPMGPASPTQWLNANRSQVTNQNVFNIQGNDPQAISKAIVEELERQNRQSMAAAGEEVEVPQ